MTELSPAAQAVLDAYWNADPKSTEHTDAYEVAGIAAAIRAAADQVVPRKNVDESAPLREITRSVQRLEIRA